MFDSWLNQSIIKKAIDKQLLDINSHDIRQFTADVHRSVDDTPYGGGAGMVMRPEPLVSCVESVPRLKKSLRVLMTPQGETLTQNLVKELAQYDQLIIICGRYEGIDERARKIVAEKEISVGDYITAGGELPALILMEATARLVPQVLGNIASLDHESFEENLLEYPQYTRPEEFQGQKVPEILLSGHHEQIEQWRQKQALKRTKERRPDLIDKTTKRR